METYNSDVRAYDTAVKANSDCLLTIGVRETYRNIFAGIELMFKKAADLPVILFPETPEAIFYQESMSNDIELLIHQPVEDGLPPREPSDCPQVPANEPERP